MLERESQSKEQFAKWKAPETETETAKPPQELEEATTPEAELRSEAEPQLHNLEQLDNEATKERIQRILETLPRGWANNILLIQFVDIERNASAGASFDELSTLPGNNIIEYFKKAKNKDPRDLWSMTLLHEVGHTVDWWRNRHLTAEEKQKLQQAILERSRASDRYSTPYPELIEDIEEKRPPTDLGGPAERRAKEYWAEIVRAYLTAEDPNNELPAADLKLVESIITKTDLAFDQRGMRLAREAVIREMESAKLERIFSLLSPEQALRIRSWLDTHMETPPEWKDAQMQEAGRRLLVELVKTWSSTPEKKELAEYALMKYAVRDRLLILIRNKKYQSLLDEMQTYKHVDEQVNLRTEKLSEEGAQDFLAKLESLINKNDIAFGSEHAALKPGEYRAIVDETDAEPDWITDAAGWQPAAEDLAYAQELAKKKPLPYF